MDYPPIRNGCSDDDGEESVRNAQDEESGRWSVRERVSTKKRQTVSMKNNEVKKK